MPHQRSDCTRWRNRRSNNGNNPGNNVFKVNIAEVKLSETSYLANAVLLLLLLLILWWPIPSRSLGNHECYPLKKNKTTKIFKYMSICIIRKYYTITHY